jgi:hypothetical protein
MRHGADLEPSANANETLGANTQNKYARAIHHPALSRCGLFSRASIQSAIDPSIDGEA